MLLVSMAESSCHRASRRGFLISQPRFEAESSTPTMPSWSTPARKTGWLIGRLPALIAASAAGDGSGRRLRTFSSRETAASSPKTSAARSLSKSAGTLSVCTEYRLRAREDVVKPPLRTIFVYERRGARAWYAR